MMKLLFAATIQVKLLRAIQKKPCAVSVMRETSVDVAVFGTTHKNLEALVESDRIPSGLITAST